MKAEAATCRTLVLPHHFMLAQLRNSDSKSYFI